ncbi:MAG: hypothetical protein KGJ13_02425 [Patescibacteria group bacterium]|nr:hypothetical protein [Patescibacteria group bacterium]
MPPANATLVTFQGGETTPKSRGRFDLQWYASSAKKLLNYIADFQGPARYRGGFRTIRQTRKGAYARFVSFDIGDAEGYELEFTAGYMRAYRNGDLVSDVNSAITGISNASPCVITLTSATGMSDGDEIFIEGVNGMPELNGRQFVLAGKSGDTFQLTDPVTAANIDSTAYGAYSSGGTAYHIYEITTPLNKNALDSLQWAADGSTSEMYFSSPLGGPYKLTVTGAATFTFGTYTRTNDPFAPLGTAVDISGCTAANPGVLSLVSAPFADGTVVYITGVVGMTELNGNQYIITGKSGSSYNLQDLLGNNLDTLAFTAYSSGGTVQQVLNSPTLTLPIAWIGPNDQQIGSVATGDQVYLQLTSNKIGPVAGLKYSFSGVVGATGINGVEAYLGPFIQNQNGQYFIQLQNADGSAYLATQNYGAYSSGGVATVVPSADVEFPVAVCFYEGRLVYGGTNLRPNSIFTSMGPDTTSGDPQYDDFTGGTNANNACFYSLAPVNGQVDTITWVRGTPGFLMVGTAGGPHRLTGNGLAQPLTPGAISAQQFDNYACEASMPAGTTQIFYLQQGGVTVRAPRMTNPYLGIFNVMDMCLNAEQIPKVLGAQAVNGVGGIKRLAFQNGRPQILWAVLNDGTIAGLSVQTNSMMEGVATLAGWHRHQIGGTDAKCIDLICVPRKDNDDQVMAVMQRTINGQTVCTVEYMADEVQFPDLEDFFSGPDNQDSDLTAFWGAVYRLQEQYVHLDGAMTYDGSARGTTAAATMTPSAVGIAPAVKTDGSSITLTASESVFLASDVGSEIWKKPDPVTGLGGGRALITAYTSGTVVTATCLTPFDSTAAIPAGQWYFAQKTISGAWPLNGQTVAVVTDGAVYSDGGATGASTDTGYPVVSIVNGAFTMSRAAAVVHVGFPYLGFLKTHNLEMGGKTGPAQTKPRNINELYIRFLWSLGTDYGTDQYRMERINQRPSNAVYDRPAPVFSGVRKLPYQDSWSEQDHRDQYEKSVVVMQKLPLPSIISFIDIRYDTTDDGDA